jgi:hypothetical protein
MADHPDLIAGLYDDKDKAQRVLARLQAAGLRPERLALAQGRAEGPHLGGGNAQSPRRIGKDAALGGVIGGALGSGAAAIIGAVAPMVFAAAPLLGPLLAAGYGATIGGTAGAVAGMRLGASDFSNVLDEALSEGYVAVLVRVANARQQEIAEQVFAETTPEPPLESQ